MEYPPPPPVPSDVDPATLAAFPLEYIAGEQQAELMAAIKVLGDDGEFPEACILCALRRLKQKAKGA